MDGRAVLDTSAVLTLFSALDLKGKELEGMEIVAPKCVGWELQDFAGHDDYLGRRAAEALEKISVKSDPLSRGELKEEKKSLGLGEGGITDCDVQALHLSFELDLPFFTDDFSAHRHFAVHYPSKSLFFGILLVLDILGFENPPEAEEFVFGKLVPRRFPEMVDRTTSNLKIAIDEFLSKR